MCVVGCVCAKSVCVHVNGSGYNVCSGHIIIMCVVGHMQWSRGGSLTNQMSCKSVYTRDGDCGSSIALLVRTTCSYSYEFMQSTDLIL